MKYFTKLIRLNEAVIIPSVIFIDDEVKTIEKQILNKNLNTKTIIDKLNKIFNKYRIYFFISNKIKNHEYMQAEINTKMDIKINVSENFSKLFNNIDIETFNANLDSLKALIGHELVHYQQMKNIKKNKSVAKLIQKLEKIINYKDQVSYISNQMEPMAYAYQTIIEFKNMGFTKEKILKRLQSPLDNSFEPYVDDSTVFYIYVTELSPKNTAYKKYFKYLYIYLNELF